MENLPNSYPKSPKNRPRGAYKHFEFSHSFIAALSKLLDRDT